MADTGKTEQGTAGNIDERLARLEQFLGVHNAYLQNQMREREQSAQSLEQARQEQELQRRRGLIAEAMSGYADQPKLQGAINFLGGKWADEAGKYGMAEADINRGVMGGFERLAHAALDNKMNPANLVYEYALSQGFKPDEAQAAAEQAAGAALADGAGGAGAKGLSGGDAAAAAEKMAAADVAPTAGFVKAVEAGKRPAGGAQPGKGSSYKAALAAKAAGNLDEYARLMAG